MSIESMVEGSTFSASPLVAKPRVIWDITKKAKAGGTHFAVATTPSLIAYQTTDTGDEGVVDKFQFGQDDKLRIVRATYRHSPPFKLNEAPTDQARPDKDLGVAFADEVTTKNLYRAVLGRWDRDFHHMIGKARTIVWDTGTEFYEILRLAQFGKLLQVKAQHYAPIYRYLVEKFNAIQNQDYTSFITISQGTGEWVETGRKNADGEAQVVKSKTKLARANWHDRVDFLVHAFFEARYVDPLRNVTEGMMPSFNKKGEQVAMVMPGGITHPGRFELELVRTRFMPEYVGTIWTDEDITFQNVASLLYPDIDYEQWLDPNPAKERE